MMVNFIDMLSAAQLGTLLPAKFRRHSNYFKSCNLTVSSNKEFNTSYSNNVYYVDLSLNRLIMASDVTQYKLFYLTVDEVYGPITGFWTEPCNLTVGLPCVTWGHNCTFFITSGYGSHLMIHDTNTLLAIEHFNLDEANRSNLSLTTLGHEACPFNNSLVAAACTNGSVPVVDLRTGNVELVAGRNLPDVSSISWSRFHEHILAVTSNASHSLQIWDVRHLRQHKTSIRCVTEMSPDLQFIDYSTLICQRNMSVDIIDIFKEEIVTQVIIEQTNRYRRKNKCAVNHNSQPKLIYFPMGEELAVLNLKNYSIVNSYRESLFPIEIAVLNESLHELYTFSDKEAIIWNQG